MNDGAPPAPGDSSGSAASGVPGARRTGAGRWAGESRSRWIIGLVISAVLGPLLVLSIQGMLDPEPVGSEISDVQLVEEDPCCTFGVQYSLKGFDSTEIALEAIVTDDDTGKDELPVRVEQFTPDRDEYQEAKNVKVAIEITGHFSVTFLLRAPEGEVLHRRSTGVFRVTATRPDGEITGVEITTVDRRSNSCCSFAVDLELEGLQGRTITATATVTDTDTGKSGPPRQTIDLIPDADPSRHSVPASVGIDRPGNFFVTFVLYNPDGRELDRAASDPFTVESPPGAAIRSVEFAESDRCCAFSVQIYAQGMTGDTLRVDAIITDSITGDQGTQFLAAEATAERDVDEGWIPAMVPIDRTGRFSVTLLLYGPDGTELHRTAIAPFDVA